MASLFSEAQLLLTLRLFRASERPATASHPAIKSDLTVRLGGAAAGVGKTSAEMAGLRLAAPDITGQFAGGLIIPRGARRVVSFIIYKGHSRDEPNRQLPHPSILVVGLELTG